MNGHSFVDVLHDEAVAILKSYQNLILSIKVRGLVVNITVPLNITTHKSIGRVPTIAPSEIQRSASLHQPRNPPHTEAVRKHSFHSSQSTGTVSNKQQGNIDNYSYPSDNIAYVTVKPVAQVKPAIKQPAVKLEKMSSTEWLDTTASTPALQFSSSPINQVRRAESMKITGSRSHSTPEVAQQTSVMDKPRPRSSIPFRPSPLLLSSNSPTSRDTKNDKRFNHLRKEELKFNSLPRGFKLQQSKAFIEGMGTQVMYASASHISAKSLLLERAKKILKEEYAVLKEKVEQVSFKLLLQVTIATHPV